jgi:hypothetical protein
MLELFHRWQTTELLFSQALLFLVGNQFTQGTR